MTNNKTFKMISYAMSFMLIMAVLFVANANNAFAASTDPVTGIYPYGNITGVDSKGNAVTEYNINKRLTSSSKSLWYNDGNTSKQIVSTYDNGGSVKYGNGTVYVTIRREGQGSGGRYVLIDGKVTSLQSTSKVVSAYPYPFVDEVTYQVKRSNAAPGAEYTILTVSYIGAAPTGSSRPYVRYDANVYIYWDNDGNAAASVLPVSPMQMMQQAISDKIAENTNC